MNLKVEINYSTVVYFTDSNLSQSVYVRFENRQLFSVDRFTERDFMSERIMQACFQILFVKLQVISEIYIKLI